MKTPNPYIFLVCLWPLGFVLIWAIWNALRDSRDEKLLLRSIDWPETKGRVLSSEVVWAHVNVVYDYFVDGKRHVGEYKISLSPVAPDRWGRGAASVSQEATKEVAAFPAGTGVTIRYNPARAEESVLYCSDEPISSPAATPEFRLLE